MLIAGNGKEGYHVFFPTAPECSILLGKKQRVTPFEPRVVCNKACNTRMTKERFLPLPSALLMHTKPQDRKRFAYFVGS